MPRSKSSPRRSTAKDTIVGRLRAADPFELIRWLARSQPDPRKAMAELVQNSLDAAARHVQIIRAKQRGVATVRVVDDGEGVIPELGRSEALTYLATHIGHSRKRNLTPQQRRELMLQGKYGIGLLGFWAIGRTLEIRTQLPGQPGTLLRLFEDSPRYEIERMRSRLALGDRYTEVVILDLHRSALQSFGARRLTDYLAAELRGQLLQRDVEITVHDKMARGLAPKQLRVEPTRFSGQRLALPDEVAVPGFSPLRVEMYLLPEGTTGEGRVSVSAAGTIVYEDVTDFEAAELDRAPWNDRRLTGLLEFPDFQVPPGARRGVLPDDAALAFAAALTDLEAPILEQLAEVERRAAETFDAVVLRQLEKIFRDVPRVAPEYDFFAVRTAADALPGAATAQSEGSTQADGSDGAEPPVPGAALSVADAAVVAEPVGEEDEPRSLFPAGALSTLEIIPAATRVERSGRRALRAVARDADGIRIERELAIEWTVLAALGRCEPPSGARVHFEAANAVGDATVVATAHEGERTARAEATVQVVESRERDASRAGIPEPAFVSEPMADWRSRMRDGRWEVNSGHRDYAAAGETPRRKLRYLATLLAKEVVLHSFPGPQFGYALERLVEVLTITEPRLERR